MNAKHMGGKEKFARLKHELRRAFGVPETTYQPLAAAEVVARNRKRRLDRRSQPADGS